MLVDKEDRAPGVTPAAPWRVTDVQALPDYRLKVRFRDGMEGTVDLSRRITGEQAGVFAALRDPAMFAKVHVECGAVTWPGRLDLAPRRHARGHPAAGRVGAGLMKAVGRGTAVYDFYNPAKMVISEIDKGVRLPGAGELAVISCPDAKLACPANCIYNYAIDAQDAHAFRVGRKQKPG